MWTAMVLLGGAWLGLTAERAANKPLWTDEVFGLQTSVRGTGFAELIIGGARGQGSPAPLDYLLLKSLDQGRNAVAYFHLRPHVYYRLIAMLSTLAAAVFVFGLALPAAAPSRTAWSRAIGCTLAVCAFVSFALEPGAFYYAAEARPYALWTALWLASALSLPRTSRSGRIVSLGAMVLLAMTATASVFQLAALVTASFIVGWGARQPWTQLAKDSLKLFGLPVAVALFYCFKVGHWDYAPETRTLTHFLSFWTSHCWVGAASLTAAMLGWMRRETRSLAIPPLGMAIFYLLGPAMFEVTKLKGFFFTERQYVGYGATVPILFVTCALALDLRRPVRADRLRLGVALLVTGFALAGTVFTAKRTIGSVSREQASWRTAQGIPSDRARLLSGLLERELPRGFCFVDRPSTEAAANVGLVADWLPVRFPFLPIGGTTVLVEARGDGARVKALGDRCDAKPEIPLVRTLRR